MCNNRTLTDLIESMSDYTTDPERPFTGQNHTEQGERGKSEIHGICFRDLADCIVKAFVNSAAFTIKDNQLRNELYCRVEDGTLNYNDLYKLDLSEMDPLALMQNTVCHVEKIMGIYPNLPEQHHGCH